MVERYLRMWGVKETVEYIKATLKGIRKVIRVNTLKVDEVELIDTLRSKGYQLDKVWWAKRAYWVIKEPFPIGATFEYMLGYYYIHRGAGSLAPVIALNPQPGEFIIDMCAAPGGKTSYIADLMKDEGVILAVDISRDRMKSLRSQISRLGISCVVGLRWDAKRVPELSVKADKVLLDAPCTGEGLTPIDPGRRLRFNVEELQRMVSVQVSLLEAALNVVKDGGVIIYSTCSIAPEENELVINKVLEKFRDRIDLYDTGLIIGDPGFDRVFNYKLDSRLKLCKRLYPHKHGTEGYFICKIVKRE